MKKTNNFVPDYLKKYEDNQTKVSKESIVVQKTSKTDLEIRSEEITNRPNLVNEHYIKGEQRKALEFFKEENIKFAIFQQHLINRRKGHGKYFINVYKCDRETNRCFTISIGVKGTDQRKCKLKKLSDKLWRR